MYFCGVDEQFFAVKFYGNSQVSEATLVHCTVICLYMYAENCSTQLIFARTVDNHGNHGNRDFHQMP